MTLFIVTKNFIVKTTNDVKYILCMFCTFLIDNSSISRDFYFSHSIRYAFGQLLLISCKKYLKKDKLVNRNCLLECLNREELEIIFRNYSVPKHCWQNKKYLLIFSSFLFFRRFGFIRLKPLSLYPMNLNRT